MDFTKIQNEVMKDSFDNYHVTKFWHGSFENESGTYHGITDGHMVVVIPENYYYLSENVFKCQKWRFKNIVKEADNAAPITLTGELLTITGKKKPLMIFKNEAGEKIYIDSALHDNFKTTSAISYKGTTPKSPIYLYVYGTLIGVILPVNHKEN